MLPPNVKYFLFFIFGLSGFSGLIYESIWSHYLKLFLGHAAYAQTLVLAVFMGGMALGAWLIAQYTHRIRSPLIGYAIVEGLIGLTGLVFHNFYGVYTNFSFNTVLPMLDNGLAINSYKWVSASLVILPTSILLGMTFPLMSTFYVRNFTQQSGRSMAMLYFSNSIGAAIGVLVSGFVLIANLGLPGTILTAGLLNVIIAIAAYGAAKYYDGAPNYTAASTTSDLNNRSTITNNVTLMLMVAFATGLASFFYEIGWIRMLSQVLGSSTHAFELMLSAFILGLALGGYWVKNKIDGLANSLQFLGWVQVVMGLLALSTILLYNYSFDLMSTFIALFNKNAVGYIGFNLSSHAIALFTMLPTTFCAGMTLPLITNILLKSKEGERAIGKIYAANTTGAILGIMLAVHIVMPLFGLKYVILAGAFVDISLGLFLLAKCKPFALSQFKVAATTACIALLICTFAIDFDPLKMASGVYRRGRATLQDSSKVLYFQDGKTATISLINDNQTIILSTNGKPDASINIAGEVATQDEITMILAGTLPLMLHPTAKTVANIGMGSGQTSHTLLGTSQITKLDTIEIEREIVNASKFGFGQHVRNAFNDSRSHIHIEDAKTFFSAGQKKYDLIVSEPSNPWVSGVATLFSDEFYKKISTHLNDDGLLFQWIQTYETNIQILSSIIKPISLNFKDYAIYTTDGSNILIVASKDREIKQPTAELFNKNINANFKRVHLNSVQDIQNRYIGNKASLDAYFKSINAPVNSDYFPYVDLNAVKSRYMQSNAAEFLTLTDAPVPLFEMLSQQNFSAGETIVSNGTFYNKNQIINNALLGHDFALGLNDGKGLNEALLKNIHIVKQFAKTCDLGGNDLIINSFISTGINVAPFLKYSETKSVMNALVPAKCHSTANQQLKLWSDLFIAVAERNAKQMIVLATELLQLNKGNKDADVIEYLSVVAMLGYASNQMPEEALTIASNTLFTKPNLATSANLIALYASQQLNK